MENNTYEPQEPNAEEQLSPSVLSQPRSQSRAWPILLGAVIVGVSLIVSSLIYTKDDKSAPAVKREAATGSSAELPVTWGDMGKRMLASGVIDEKAFESLYATRGGMSPEMQAMLSGDKNGNIRITSENAGTILNLLWALGLGQKSDVLEKGEMADPRYGDPSGFASTGGWTLANGSPMSHYSMHEFVTLDADAKAKVERVTKNIYRPCCGNSTHFPDCNHGMAMLGLMELMASQGASDEEMYRTAVLVNSFWFPDQYATIARYFTSDGTVLKDVDPKKILSAAYSSGAGYQAVEKAVSQLQGPAEAQPRQSGGCGV